MFLFKFELVLHIVLVFSLLTLNKQILNEKFHFYAQHQSIIEIEVIFEMFWVYLRNFDKFLLLLSLFNIWFSS